MTHTNSTPINPARGGSAEELLALLKGCLSREDKDGGIWVPADYIRSAIAAIGAGGQAVASLDDVAARMWKADAEDSGTPASVAAGRTRGAFDDQSEELKARWRKIAKAASSVLSQPPPADERVVEALRQIRKLSGLGDVLCEGANALVMYRMADIHQHADAALANATAQPGWRLVPEEPTEAMLDAGEGFNIRCGCPDCDHSVGEKIAEGWRAMLAAAPLPEGRG